MIQNLDAAPLHILHVLTLSGKNGEYGGPNRVAREICKALDRSQFKTRIFSGAMRFSLPIPEDNLDEEYVIVSPIWNQFPISSLCSKKILFALWRQIRRSDLVHIHFARDLIPILAAIICRIQRKPYVTQTHGMVVPDTRKIALIIDRIFVKSILGGSRTNFVLSDKELIDMHPLALRCPFVILPNGIQVPESVPLREPLITNRIAFCSRVQSRKRPELFLALAKYSRVNYPELSFEIYGPDGGELPEVLRRLGEDLELKNTTYRGAIEPSQVTSVLSQIDLVVLPSVNEQFPMVVLESLSVGTPVLIMPSNGLAHLLEHDLPGTTCRSEDLEGLISAFHLLYKREFLSGERENIQEFCRSTFQISSVTKSIENLYLKVLKS